MDIFTYANSKSVYVERHHLKEVKQLYPDVLTEKQLIRNLFILATQAPDEFVVAGEVVHIVQCDQAKDVFREAKECYMQLPGIKENRIFL